MQTVKLSQLTKWQLFSLLAEPHPEYSTFVVTAKDGLSETYLTAIITAVQREDGSGRSFNLTVDTLTGRETIHVRTID